MNQFDFEQCHAARWSELEAQMAAFAPRAVAAAALPDQYSAVCQQLAVAKQRGYSSDLLQRLNTLVLQMHHHIYRHNPRNEQLWLRFALLDFPRSLRANAGFIAVAAMLFVGPAILMALACWHNEDMIYSLIDAAQVREIEHMYDPASRALGRAREADTDMLMFGFYIRNNIGIAFQTFAGGVIVAVGPATALIYNGAFLGAVAGHLARAGYSSTFFPFVVGHGALELTAIVFSGAAGLKLGFAWLAPGNLTRRRALRLAAGDAVRIVYGAALMLLAAAFLEAFWSSRSDVLPATKYVVGGILWAVVFLYCTVCGRAGQGVADGY